MKILVVNCGSSSLKYQLIDMETEEVMAKGYLERIGLGGSFLTHTVNGEKHRIEKEIANHEEAMNLLLEQLLDKEYGVISDLKEINAVGHRVVHGGEKFSGSVVITDEVINAIKECIPLAPLHNPAGITGIEACKKALPNVPMVGVFDTAFHQTLDPKAYMYAIPYEYYEKYKIRKYGFHGTSHRFVSNRVAEIVNKPIEDLKIITCHLGQGASLCAVKNGKSVDTSMGLTPLAGVPMGSRSGDIDPSIVTFLMEKEGLSAKEMDNILNKKCGIDNISLFDSTNFKTKLDAEVKNYNPLDYFDLKQSKRLDRVSQFAIIAAREAVTSSGITKENTDMNRVGVLISSGIGGLGTIEKENKIMLEKGPDRVSPMYIPMSIVNMAAGNVAIEIGAKGESISIVTACSSGTHSIGEAYRMIKHGYEDVIFAGGSEASITPSGVAGFTNIKALNTTEDVTRASIPFDKERNGFVIGEGAGILVLEEYKHAKKRGAKIYAEVVGYGATSDAYHITSPAPEGEGAARAITRAIEDAKIKPEEITYINAHGTSTHLNDSCETMAVKKAFNEASKNVMMSSTKGNTGHLLGAAGGIEAVVCAKAIEDSFVPPTINYRIPDEECDLDIVPNRGRNVEIKYAMSNSLGFGGHNASIILKKI